AHLELHVHRGSRFAGGPAGGAPRRGWGLATVRAHGARATRTLRTGRGRSWACCRRAFLQAGVRRWRGGVWREERLLSTRRQVEAVCQPVGVGIVAGVAALRTRALLRRDAGLLPAQGVGVFIAGEVRYGVGLRGGETM